MRPLPAFDERFLAARREAFAIKVRDKAGLGWSPALRQRYGYFTPDECYEGLVHMLVAPATRWLDVGCGHNLFPSNPNLSRALADRCALLVGIDPDETIEKNPYVHQRVRGLLGDYRPDAGFDLITLRMVAEHVTEPHDMLAQLARLLAPGGRVVVYTVSKWSPSSLLAAATPMAVHHWLKKHLWRVNPEDTFPTAYLLNTRAALSRLFAAAGMDEERFLYLDDCRSFSRWKLTTHLELTLQRGLRGLGLRYPEVCLLGIYGHSRPAG
jgi:2-polyprenyl-3-methyl-5-hydroxy-6-metoxy-1,4-benzoquinol methylase